MKSRNNVGLKAVDFFCGAGGMTFGLRQAGINVIVGIDIDPTCKETYEENNKPSKFIQADIHDLSEEELAEMTSIHKNDDSLVFIGCSPCQYWTKINTDKKKAIGTKDLLAEFKRFVKYFRPGYLIIENVPGLYKKRKVNALSGFLGFLKRESYAYDHGVINANHFGVPQTRNRYLLVATRNSRDIRLPDGETNGEWIVRSYLGEKNGFPKVEAGYKDRTKFLHKVMELSEKNKTRIGLTPINGGTRMSWKDYPELQLKAYQGKDDCFRNVYGRMFWDKPAPTITTKFNSLSNGRFGHPEENRAISLREGATLQTFPKSYEFFESREAIVARHIGNAVPPELARRVGLGIIRSWENAIVSG